MQWHVLYTAPRAEKQVANRLEKFGVEVFLPLHLSPRRWSDRIKLIEVPLFSSYIFVRTNLDTLRETLTVQGVLRIVYYNHKPAVIREKEIIAIQTFLELAREKAVNFVVDDDVLIACGPLKNISGKIKRIGKKYILLHLEQLGLTVSVAVDQVVKAKNN